MSGPNPEPGPSDERDPLEAALAELLRLLGGSDGTDPSSADHVGVDANPLRPDPAGGRGDNGSPALAAALAAVEAEAAVLRARNRELEASASELELEHRRYRELFEGVPDGYVITEEEGVIIEGNQMAGHLLGVPRRHLAGRSFADYIAEGDQGAFYTELARLRSHPAAESSTVELVLEGDQPFPAELHGVVERYGRGGGHTIRWLVRDRRSDPMTARLQADEQQLRSLLQTAPVAIVLWDAAGDLLYANNSARDLLDPGPGAVTLDEWLVRVQPDDGPTVGAAPAGERSPTTAAAALADLRAGAAAAHLAHRLTDREGHVHWLDHDITVVRGPEGVTHGFVSTIVDLTAERRAEHRLTSAIEFADAIFDTVGAVVLVIDSEGRLERCNHTSELVTGFRSAELTGERVVDILIPEDARAAFERELTLLVDQRTPRVFEGGIRTAGGVRRIVWTNTVLTGDDGSVRAIISTGVDVTEQRLLESRLAQRARLESVGQVAAGLSHDFNNTLTVLQARTERISARHDDGATRTDVEAINRTVDRTTRLISQLLSFSGRRQVEPEPMEVNTELDRAVALMADLMGDAMAVTLDLTTEDTTIAMDPSRFDQVITNLAINARDAMPDGGILQLRTRVDSVRAGRTDDGHQTSHLDDGRYVRVAVTDTGVGIEPHLLTRVFDPYFTTKPAAQGTGLGLATTYGTIVQAGGDIVADSNLGRGTTITFWLPLLSDHATSEDPVAEAPAADEDPANGGHDTDPSEATGDGTEGRRDELVLVVDDDEELLAVLTGQLAGNGRRVLGATSAEQVLDGPLDPPPDLLVTDVQLPGLDGVELAHRLWRRLPDLPVVLITGAQPDDLPEIPAGVAVLVKPVPGERLRATVDTALAPHR